MQQSKLTFVRHAIACAAVLAAAGAHAQPAPLGVATPIAAAPSFNVAPAAGKNAAEPAASLASRASAVQIGTPGADTLAEYAELQRQMRMAEMRKRLKEVTDGPSAATGAAPGMPPMGGVVPPALPMPTLQATPVVAPVVAAPLDESARIKVVNIVVSMDRARADIAAPNGVTKTVRAGDTVDGWTVASIRHNEVIVEKAVKGKEPKTLTERLELFVGNSTPAVLTALPAAGAPAQPVPPLPRGIADSTTVPEPPVLPPR